MGFWEWFGSILGVIVDGDGCVLPTYRCFVSFIDLSIRLTEGMLDFLVGLGEYVSNAQYQLLAFHLLYPHFEWGKSEWSYGNLKFEDGWSGWKVVLCIWYTFLIGLSETKNDGWVGPHYFILLNAHFMMPSHLCHSIPLSHVYSECLLQCLHQNLLPFLVITRISLNSHCLLGCPAWLDEIDGLYALIPLIWFHMETQVSSAIEFQYLLLLSVSPQVAEEMGERVEI